MPLGVSWSIALTADVQKKQTANVLGRLPGRDPVLAKQVVIYTAHHDHLGMRAAKTPGEDVIYNGAHDNATGVAAVLSIVRAMKALPQRPRAHHRVRAGGGRGAGAAGLQVLRRPSHRWPPGLIAANINIDGLNIHRPHPRPDHGGHGQVQPGRLIKQLAAMQGRTVVPDQFPDRGFFYRSDQFPWPASACPPPTSTPAPTSIGKPAGYGKEQAEKFEAKDYHQPSDELRATGN